MKNLADRLKHVRTFRRKISQAEFSARVGLTQTTWGRYERGENIPDATIIARICEETGVSLHWLLLGRGPMLEEEDSNNAMPGRGVAQVPLLGFEPTAVAGWFRPISLAIKIPYENPNPSVMAVAAFGDGMLPEGIRNGYILFCDSSREPEAGDVIYAQRHDGTAAIRLVETVSDEEMQVRHWHNAGQECHQISETLSRESLQKVASVVQIKRKA